MGISDKLVEEALEYLRLEDFLTVLQFSLIDERSADNSFQVFSNFLDKGLTVSVAEIGYVGDGLRAYNSDIKVALHKVENDLFDTNEPEQRIYKRYTVEIPDWGNIAVGDLLIKRGDIHDLYRDAYDQGRYPWALTKWPSSEKEWRWYATKPKANTEQLQQAHKVVPRHNIDLTVLMQLLDCSSPQDCWLFNDCEIDDSGIRSKPIDKQSEELLIGDEWQTRKQFEQDIQLSLPCSLDDVECWAEKNGFEEIVFDNIHLLKERRLAIAKTKADRITESEVKLEELLNKPIVKILTSKRLDIVEEFDRCFHLYVWQDVLNQELARVNQAPYQFEESRKADKNLIISRLDEIDGLLNGESDSEKEPQSMDEGLQITPGIKRKRQDNLTKAIIAAMAAMKRKPSLDDLWQYFMNDLDQTGFIVDFMEDVITWTDTKGKCHDTKLKTLANRLSKLHYPR